MNLKKVPTIHQTDCFHPHGDPDDHWDLACQFALAHAGLIDLKGILIDYPPNAYFGDPAIGAVSQLSVITGETAAVGVGCETKAASDADISEIASRKPMNAGLHMVLKILEEADEPVTLHIVGSARDIAVASTLRPDLFREKCKALYLNAGSATGSGLEYNVELDPFSYSKMFDLPCPLYWMPCFHECGLHEVGTYGTYWRFRQNEILPHLSERMQNYFTYALGRVPDYRWLTYINQPVNQTLLQEAGEKIRNMWCTAGFLHAAGKTVTADGEIVALGTPDKQPVFDFIPVSVTCADDGRTTWDPAPSDTRFIFKVLDEEHYRAAMTTAMRTLLKAMP